MGEAQLICRVQCVVVRDAKAKLFPGKIVNETSDESLASRNLAGFIFALASLTTTHCIYEKYELEGLKRN